MAENGGLHRIGDRSVYELVTGDDTMELRFSVPSTPMLTGRAAKLASVLKDAFEHLGTIGADARGRYLTPP